MASMVELRVRSTQGNRVAHAPLTNESRVRSELNLNFQSHADASWRHGKCIVLSFSRIFRSGGFTVALF